MEKKCGNGVRNILSHSHSLLRHRTRDVYVRRCTVLKKYPSELRFLFPVSHILNNWLKILPNSKNFNKLKKLPKTA